MNSFRNYLSLVKFSHTVFALPFAVIGFFLGVKAVQGVPDWILFVKVILCMVFARTAAMAFNRFADRNIDIKNDRTKMREIPAGQISPSAAIILVIASSILFIITAYTINPICFYLTPVALAVILGYSLTKRYTAMCHFILGLGLSLAPLGGYLAVTGAFHLLPVLFSLAVLTWVSGFDIIYALQDEEFDQSQKLFSIPVAIGRKNALIVSGMIHIITSLLLISAGVVGEMGLWYWTGCGIFIGLLAYQHSLVKPTDLRRVNLAFFTTNGIASVMFATFAVIELLK